MTQPVPAAVGDSLADVATPALIVELDALERNIAKMATLTGGTGVRLRPHAKSHKCVEIARRQVAAGAVGVCCQKVSEAAAFVEGGIADVFVSNEVVGRKKQEQLAALADRAHLSVCVDDADNVRALDAFGRKIDVHVEVDVGTPRCGVPPGEPTLALARVVANSRHLRFAGLHGYHGMAQHLRTVAERKAAITGATEQLKQTRALLEKHDLRCEILTGAGTGTFPFELGGGL